jgi:hypothetical protein
MYSFPGENTRQTKIHIFGENPYLMLTMVEYENKEATNASQESRMHSRIKKTWKRTPKERNRA